MLTIRLARAGKRNKAQFKIMLQERTIAPGGRHVEILGSHNPHSKVTVLNEERIKYWIEKGAHTSDTVYNLLVKNAVITGEKRKVKLPEKKVAVAEVSPEGGNKVEAKAEDAVAEIKTKIEDKIEEVAAPVVEEMSTETVKSE
ncbi:MAG: 30S ribosomal protein S16 [Candidatus Moraniibacteriota bacterium]